MIVSLHLIIKDSKDVPDISEAALLHQKIKALVDTNTEDLDFFIPSNFLALRSTNLPTSPRKEKIATTPYHDQQGSSYSNLLRAL
ncbi:hypothetical protein GIB67_014157 [Kingdonia uniflora]|uniref:Uncharacterized protein n=1 Tax=Kingdonia uniflora TaxID=39325 RepID=A0A7J7N482_9MAGN|nr:hypothetical protein GIB67_014157 [Kingdonia uniflora]